MHTTVESETGGVSESHPWAHIWDETRVYTRMRLEYMRHAGPPADAPPRDEVTESHDVSFMTMRRSLWKSFAFFMGLVKKSARLSCVLTKGTSISNDSTMSRTK